MLVDPLVAPLDEGADGGRRGVEDTDAVLFDHLPPAAAVRAWRAFVHEHRRAAESGP